MRKIEMAAGIFGAGLVYFSGIFWIGVVAAKLIFYREPLLYQYFPKISVETLPLASIAAVLATGVCYCTVLAAVTGEREAPVLGWLAPRVLAFVLPTLVLWLYFKPSPKASLFPPVGLAIFVGWCWYVSAWGYLSGRKERSLYATADAQTDRARVSRPASNFSAIHGNDEIKARLVDAAGEIVARKKGTGRARNGILLHGLPGNGKTVFAEALAGELKIPLVTVSYADINSKWIGETSVRVRAAFELARRKQPCVLFIDEIDSFLESRDAAGGIKDDRDLVNALLTLMVDIRHSRVVLVAATNYLDRLDAAGIREGRFDFKIEITPPDLEARLGLLKKGLRDNLPAIQVPESVIQSVAQRWNGFSVKRILAVTEELPAYVKAHGLNSVGYEDIMGALRQLQGQRGHVPENVKPLEELVFSENTREMLDLIVGRMADPEHTEQHGGTLPVGVLFYGPPGTGKTAGCKALARALGWAYLPATGADLARDPKRLEALYAKAQDLRPTIIFIDEADELLRDRNYSNVTEATNKLLTLMDGVADRVRDVVWIAATNHPDQIDPALLRGGRFAEKVIFELPTRKDLAFFMEGWLQRKRVKLAEGLDGVQIADAVGDSSIANAEAMLQAAVNRAVSRRENPVVVRLEDVQRAVTLVNGVAL